MEKKKLKNYVILAIIFILTIGIVVYLSNWYKTLRNCNPNETVLKNVISEVKLDDLENYIIENPNTIIYVTSGIDNEIKAFENSFKNTIKKEELQKEIVFLNIGESNKNNEKEYLNKNLDETLKQKNPNLEIVPNLYIIRDGYIIDMLYHSETKINKDDLIQFLEEYEVIEP